MPTNRKAAVVMITKIEINNFCIFKGKNVFYFDQNKPLTLVSSPRASGKTTIFNALIWCLYGAIPNVPSIIKYFV